MVNLFSQWILAVFHMPFEDITHKTDRTVFASLNFNIERELQEIKLVKPSLLIHCYRTVSTQPCCHCTLSTTKL